MIVLTEKSIQHEGCEFSFIWGLTEDYSLGDSLSGSSEELLQRVGGGGGGQYIYDFGEGGTGHQAYISVEGCS